MCKCVDKCVYMRDKCKCRVVNTYMRGCVYTIEVLLRVDGCEYMWVTNLIISM